jgi:glycerol-3-phosphate dehydrogenase (NAD(P)+)
MIRESMNKFNRIGVYGGGSWGAALACQAARCNEIVQLFLRNQDVINEISRQGTIRKYFDDMELPRNINPSSDISLLLDQEVIIIAIPSTAFNSTLLALKEVSLPPETNLLIATKGIGSDPIELFSDKIKAILPNPIAFISGPNLAKEVAKNSLSSATIASCDINLAGKLANSLTGDNFIVTTTDDIITMQIAGAMKNIIAIKSGIYDAKGYGENARAWLITEGLKEITLLSKALGGRRDIMTSPAVLGDLVLTCYSKTSRNTRFGYEFYQHKDRNKFLKSYTYLAEGLESIKLVLHIARKHDLELPIVTSVAKLLDGYVES